MLAQGHLPGRGGRLRSLAQAAELGPRFGRVRRHVTCLAARGCVIYSAAKVDPRYAEGKENEVDRQEIEAEARRRYTRCPTVKPDWEQLTPGGATQQAWMDEVEAEMASAAKEQAVPAHDDAAKPPEQLGLFG